MYNVIKQLCAML